MSLLGYRIITDARYDALVHGLHRLSVDERKEYQERIADLRDEIRAVREARSDEMDSLRAELSALKSRLETVDQWLSRLVQIPDKVEDLERWINFLRESRQDPSMLLNLPDLGDDEEGEIDLGFGENDVPEYEDYSAEELYSYPDTAREQAISPDGTEVTDDAP